MTKSKDKQAEVEHDELDEPQENPFEEQLLVTEIIGDEDLIESEPPPSLDDLPGYLFNVDDTLEPMPIAELREEHDPIGRKISSEEILGQLIYIHKADIRKSSKKANQVYLFIVAKIAETNELVHFNTSAGAVLSSLAIPIKVGFMRPVSMVISQRDGGRYGKFFIVE